jgi:hypothetical protein
MSAGIQASEVFHVPTSAPPTDDDRVNSSHAYGFVAEVVASRSTRSPGTCDPQVRLRERRGDDHQPEAGRRADYGSRLHGLGGALLEEFRWDEDGQFLTGTFADYRCLTAARRRGSRPRTSRRRRRSRRSARRAAASRRRESAPAAVANAVADALRPLGAEAHAPAADAGAALGAAAREAGAVRVPPAGVARRGARAPREDRDAKPLAGGQSLVPMLNFRLAQAVRAGRPAGSRARGIRVEDGALVVGAMTRQWDLEHHADAYPLLRDALAPRRPHGDALPRHGRRLARPRRPDRGAPGLRARARGRARDESPHDSGRAVLHLGVHDRTRAGRAARRGSLPAAGRAERVREVAHRDGDFAVVCAARAGERVALGGVGGAPVLWDGGDLDPIATCSRRRATSAASPRR